jgi:DNA-binding Xre family transcriptional regulator
VKDYPTRLDSFRRAERIDPTEWATEAGMAPQRFARYRAGVDPRVSTAATFVRAAGKVLNRPVRVSELYDVGEDQAVTTADVVVRPARERHANDVRQTYDTPLDRLLVELDIRPAELAREADTARSSVQKMRAGREEPRMSTLAKIVSAIRRISGHPIRAKDLYDVGEE